MKPHHSTILIIIAAALAAAACGNAPISGPDLEREKILDQAFELADTDPSRAIALFADAGPGPVLEVSRLTVWSACLEKTKASPDQWRRFIDEKPPESLAVTARLALIQALVDLGDDQAALVERHLLPVEDHPKGDELLAAATDSTIRLEASRRLAISSPSFLAATERELDLRLAANLSPGDMLERSRSWRRAGQPRRAASELRKLKWRGNDENGRRRELAKAELAAGSPSRALNALPSGRSAGAEDMVLRAQALRSRGWHLFPGRGERRLFEDCIDAAESALNLDGKGEHSHTAHVLRLECATQAGRLSAAVESWRLLEAVGWKNHRREWLGRRLGVALAVAGRDVESVREMARSIPKHERCLRYWAAVGTPARQIELEALSSAGSADLYALWSRETVGRPGSPSAFSIPAMAAGEPPPAVLRLLDSGLKSEALRLWRRFRHTRAPFPDEALAAAEATADHGWPTDSIRWLLSGFPELGTIDMDRLPVNVVRTYLPLRWSRAMAAAARESGLDPWLIAGVARQESGFAAHAVSSQGAIGVLQLLPSTGRLHARALGLGSQPDLRDPETNIRLGARELGSLMRRFGAVEPALAAYNGGLKRVRGWWKRWPDRQRFTEEIPVPETYNYVRRVVFLSEAYRLVYDEEWRDAQ